MRHAFSLLALVAILGLSAIVRAENWPAWRGPTGLGVSTETTLPLEWTQEKNNAWAVPLPGPGNSTPIVWDERIFVSAASSGGKVRGLYCFHRDDGRELWRDEVPFDGKESTHDTNPYCSASPVTDGERVVVWHGSAGMFAYDLAGKRLWSVETGGLEHIWGNAASPVLAGDLVILSCGPGLTTYLAAYDKRSGELRWKKTPADATSTKADEFRGSWSTPVVHTFEGRTELLVSLPLALVAFDPATGDEIWRCRGLSKLVYTSPLVGNGVAVAMSGYHGPALAVRLGGKGDVTETHRLWLHEEKIPQRVGSGVIAGKHVYILNEPGIAYCLDLQTGERKWEQRVAGSSWSSMVLAGDRIYVCDMNGNTTVLAVDPEKCQVLAVNKIQETTRASLAPAEGRIYLRTYQKLYCFRQP